MLTRFQVAFDNQTREMVGFAEWSGAQRYFARTPEVTQCWTTFEVNSWLTKRKERARQERLMPQMIPPGMNLALLIEDADKHEVLRKEALERVL